MPRIATDQASRTARVPSRSSLTTRPLPLVAEAISRSRLQADSSGGSPSSRALATSSTVSNGLPPVTAHASRQKASSTAGSSPGPFRYIVRHQLPDRVRGECGEPQRAHAAAGRQRDERLRAGRHLVRPVGEHQQQRQPLDPGGEGGQPGQRLGIGPVGVVQHQHQRPPGECQVGDHPVQAVADTLRVGQGGAGVPLRAEADRARDDLVPAAEEGALPLRVDLGQQRSQQAADHVEGRALLLLAAACGEHQQSALLGPGAYLGDHAGLAETGRPGEDQQSLTDARGRSAGREAVQRLAEDPEFEFALQQSATGAPVCCHLCTLPL